MGLLPGEGEATWRFSAVGYDGEAITTLGFSECQDPDLAVISAQGAWFDNLLPLQGLTVTLVGTEFRKGQDGGDDIVAVAASGATGAVNSELLPASSAILVEKLTGLGGRSHRGRMFIPGVTEQHQANGSLTVAAIGLWAAALGAFQDDLVADGNIPAILHKAVSIPEKVIPAVVRNAVVASPLLDSSAPGLSLEAKLATQRRRIRR